MLLVYLFCILLIALSIRWYHSSFSVNVPGPRGIPLLYSFPLLAKNKGHICDWLLTQTIKYGDVWSMCSSPAKDWAIIDTDLRDIEYVLHSHFDDFVKGDRFKKNMKPLLGDGIFNTNGANWKSQRRIASHLFKISELREMAPVFLKHSRELVEIFKNNNSQLVDIQDLMARYTLDSIGEIAFGTELNSLQKQVPFSEAFNTATLCTESRFFKFWWAYLPTSFVDFEIKLKEAVKTLDDFAFTIIGSKRKKPNDDFVKTDLLDRYLNYKDNENNGFSDKYIRDIVMNFIIAGRDTTSQTLTWCFYLLSQHPKKFEILKNEISEKLGGNSPAYNTIPDLKYLEAVINETLRLYPPVPIDSKTSLVHATLPSGCKVKPGFIVNYAPYVLGRHPKYWENPSEFRPERWLGQQGEGFPIPKLQVLPFIPFNYGPRTCLGIKMAYLEVSVALCVIIQSGISLNLKEGFKPQMTPAITMYSKNGMWMIPNTD